MNISPILSLASSPQSLIASTILSASMRFTYLDPKEQGDRLCRQCAWLISLNLMTSSSISVVANNKNSPFADWHSIRHMYNRFFLIHSPVDGHSRSSFFSATENSAARNFAQLYPVMGFLTICQFSFRFFWETDILFSTMILLMYIPNSKGQGFSLLSILTSACYLQCFWHWPVQ